MPAAIEPAAPPVVKSNKPMQFVVPKRERAPAEVTRRYWLGTMGDSPRQNFALDAAGFPIEFPRYSGHFTINEFGAVEGNPQRGAFRELTEAQANGLLKSAANFVVRKSARPKEGQPWIDENVGDVLDVRGGDPKFAPHNEKGDAILTYREPTPPQEPDEPLGRYLFLYPVDPGVALPENPEPMVARSAK